jgi:hypothetical protein
MTVAQDFTEVDDLGGYAIHASDGEIGRVDQHDLATGVGYLLVATGPWILGRTVLLPASVIERVDHENQGVYVSAPGRRSAARPNIATGSRIAPTSWTTTGRCRRDPPAQSEPQPAPATPPA